MDKYLKFQFEKLPFDIQEELKFYLDEGIEICIIPILRVYEKLTLYNDMNLIRYGYSQVLGRYYDAENFNRQKKIKEAIFKELEPFIFSYCEDRHINHGYSFKIIHPNEIIKKLEDKDCPYSLDLIKIITGKKRHTKRSKQEKENTLFKDELNKILSKPQ